MENNYSNGMSEKLAIYFLKQMMMCFYEIKEINQFYLNASKIYVTKSNIIKIEIFINDFDGKKKEKYIRGKFLY